MCPGSCDGQPGPREPRVLRFKPLGATAYLAIPYWIKKAFGRYKPSTAFLAKWAWFMTDVRHISGGKSVLIPFFAQSCHASSMINCSWPEQKKVLNCYISNFMTF